MMATMTAPGTVLLFLLGLALGSFLNVLASRYDPEKLLLTRNALGGRSRCDHCGKTLAWYELVPLLSFLWQRGRCRSCGRPIGRQHLWAELASGLLVALVPLAALGAGLGPAAAVAWTLVFLGLLLLTLIDLRSQLIPDEITVALGLAGLAIAHWGGDWAGHLAAAAGAAAFFALLIAVTRGRGMGWGDVKLVFVLGLLFGWPDTLLLVMLAFVVGAAVGVVLIARGTKNMKSAVPFGPFLALAAALIFFFGDALLESWYNLLI